MDKQEFKERISAISDCLDRAEYEEALDLLDSVNWRKIHNVNLLMDGADLYERAGKIYDAKELLEIAHDRSPIGRMIIYRLANVCAGLGQIEEAKDYHQKFIELAPNDSLRYVIKYNINKNANADDGVLIGILEDLKSQEFLEEWAFELAGLYRKTNQIDKCLALLDEIILWFGDGPYVEKAYEMKMLYKPLTQEQEIKYRQMTSSASNITEIRPGDTNVSRTEIIGHTIRIPQIEETFEKYNTQNLQAEIRKNIEEIMKASEVDEVSDNIDAIKELVEYIPYLAQEESKDPVKQKREDTQKVGVTLKNRFREYLQEEFDGQISLNIPGGAPEEEQLEGQLTIADVMARWEKTSRAAAAALSDAKEHELLASKQKALAQASGVLGKLALAEQKTFPIPKINAEGEHGGVGLEIPIISTKQKPDEDASKKEIQDDKQPPEAVVGEEIPSDKKTLDMQEESLSEDLSKDFLRPDMKEESLSEDLSRDFLRPDMKEESLSEDLSKDFLRPDMKEESLSEDLSRDFLRPDMKEESLSLGLTMDILFPELKDESLSKGLTAKLLGMELLDESLSKGLTAKLLDMELLDESLSKGLTAKLLGMELFDESLTKNLTERLYRAGVEVDPEIKEKIKEMSDESLTRYLRADFIHHLAKTAPVSARVKPGSSADMKQAQNILEGINDMLQKEIDRLMKSPGEEAAESKKEEVTIDTAMLPKIDINIGLELTETQKATLKYFAEVSQMQDALVSLIASLKQEHAKGGKHQRGNVVITGREGTGKTRLAVNILKILQEEISYPQGQIGRISGDKLNEKDIVELFNHIKGGALIIESAGKLEKNTMATLNMVMDNDNSGVLVIIEDTREAIEEVLQKDRQMALKFSEKIDIPDMSLKELVGFGKYYAAEKGYVIDEMGILAMYDSLDLIGRPNSPATISDVKQLVDQAIYSFQNTRKGIFEILSGKNSSEDDMPVLEEKNFRND